MRLGPQDTLVGGAAAVGGGGSAPAAPTQKGTMFGAKDAAAEFRIKVSSQMSLEHVDAQEGTAQRPAQRWVNVVEEDVD